MKTQTIFIAAIVLMSVQSVKAQLEPIDCGLTYFYDNAGNRILRMIVPCPGSPYDTTQTTDSRADRRAPGDSTTIASFQIVMINPNPTAGPFMVTCNQNLVNANLTIMDNGGQIVYQSVINGTQIPLDISNLTAGTYDVVVTSQGNSTVKKLVKSPH